MAPKRDKTPTPGALRVWHIPQIPGEAFRVPVADTAQARVVLDALADYDVFQLEHHIKPDYSNVQGLEVFEDGEWSEWRDPETDNDIDGRA